MLLYILKKEEIEYSKELAMAQILIDKEKGLEQFEKYRKKMFPWVDTAKTREKDLHKKILMDAIKQGPLSIQPIQTAKVTSRLVRRKQAEAPEAPVDKKKLDQLYSRLGKIVPT